MIPYQAVMFEDNNLQIHTCSDDRWTTAYDLSRVLGYARADSVSQLVRRNPLEFEGKFIAINLMAQKKQVLKLLNQKGVLTAATIAKTPRASAFRIWAVAGESHCMSLVGASSRSPRIEDSSDIIMKITVWSWHTPPRIR
jgi:prophage antirepressor-like protein